MKEALHIHNFPEDLRRQIKAAAAISGMSIKDWVIEAVNAKLSNVVREEGRTEKGETR